jgi:alkylation response protein AidB-like acyl-CoA dehydrogenase
MDVTYPPEAEAFRERIRAFLSENLPEGWRGLGALSEPERMPFELKWRETLADNGLLVASWPTGYGGSGLSLLEQVVIREEFARVGAPGGSENDAFSIHMLGNTLIAMGSDEQKAEFLPKIVSGEHVWCQGYSEPDAGSDLAGIRTRAELDGDEWVINGQKTWTSSGQYANWIFVLARTDPDAPKHRGISFFLVPMDQPGVEVRPIKNAAGYELFNEVFFTDARTRADLVVGGVNNGWMVAMTLLGFERGAGVTTQGMQFGADIDRLIALARERGLTDDPRIRQELAWCWSRVEVMRYRGYAALTRFLSGQKPGADAAISKIVWSEFFRRYTEIAVEILGLDAVAPYGEGSGGALQTPDPGIENSPRSWIDTFMHARSATIYAGSSEIQRNIIGEQLLGLPKEPRMDAGPFRTLAKRAG